MFDLEEINMRPSSGKLQTKSAGVSAEQIGRKMQAGDEFECNRISRKPQHVSPKVCIDFYNNATRRGDKIACLECAKVQIFLKREDEIMGRPAKKGTPDQIVVESREIHTKSVVVNKTPVRDTQDPFAGWVKYNLDDSRIKNVDVFATNSGKSLQFSKSANSIVSGFKSIDLFYKDGRIGCVMHEDESGVLKLRSDGHGRHVCSSVGFNKSVGFPDELCKKRGKVIVHRPGMVEIYFEVAA